MIYRYELTEVLLNMLLLHLALFVRQPHWIVKFGAVNKINFSSQISDSIFFTWKWAIWNFILSVAYH